MEEVQAMGLLDQWFGDAPGRQGAGFGGKWFTSFGPMTLHQSGNRITGTYGPSGTENTFEGVTEHGVLAFRYAEEQEQGAGSLRLKRANHFSGTYLADGRPRSLPWLGWRGFDGLWDTSIGRLRLIEGVEGVQAMHEFPGAQLTCTRDGDKLAIELASGTVSGRGRITLDAFGTQFNGEWQDAGQTPRPFAGGRVMARSGLNWLVVLEAHWQRGLEDAEFAFGRMLTELFARIPRIQVRHRYYHDEGSLLHWCRQLLFVAEPIVLVITGHGEANGLSVNGQIVPLRGLIKGLGSADAVQLLHFSSCLIGQDSEQVFSDIPIPVSGYTTSVDWAESALTEFIYLDMMLEKGLRPHEAATQLLKLVRFAGDEPIPGSPYHPAGFRFFAPAGEPGLSQPDLPMS
jgi:hypothetical protein